MFLMNIGFHYYLRQKTIKFLTNSSSLSFRYTKLNSLNILSPLICTVFILPDAISFLTVSFDIIEYPKFRFYILIDPIQFNRILMDYTIQSI